LTRLTTDYAASPYAANARKRLATAQASSAGPFPPQVVSSDWLLGSPDGKSVLFRKDRADTGRIYLRDLASGAERLIIDLPNMVGGLVWSPDSRQLAFNLQDSTEESQEIRIVTIASRESRTMGARGSVAAWTTSGELFILQVNLAVNTADWSLVSATGGEPRKVIAASVSQGGLVRITPDARTIVITRSKRLVVVDLATGTERPITTNGAEETRPVLSPDGRLLAFASNPDGRWAIYVAPLDRIPVRTPLRIAYVDQPGLVLVRYGLADWWTRDGLAMSLGYADSNIYRVTMNRTTGRAVDAPERLTHDSPHNTLPAVAPDGRHIAYYARSGSKGGIAVMDANGVSERPLIEQAGALPLAWRSPDEILFHNFATTAGQKPAITSLNIATGGQQAVAQVEGLYWTYVPARQEILHFSPGGGNPRPGAVLKAYSVVNRVDRTVATIDYLSPVPSVSPDGRTIAYVAFPGSVFTGSCELAAMSINGVRERVLRSQQQECMVPARGPTAWSPDGKYLLLDGDKFRPHVMEVATGATWPLLGDSADGGDWMTGGFAPDGSSVLLTRSANRAERLSWSGVTYEAVVKLMGRAGSSR
jgi:Tol biopolymer transport system component